MKILTIDIPAGVYFSDLDLKRNPITNEIILNWATIKNICLENQLDVAEFIYANSENVSALIAEWYRVHLKRGGAPDPTQEQIIASAKRSLCLYGESDMAFLLN